MITCSVRQNSGAPTLCLFICCCGSVTGLTIWADTFCDCFSTFQKRTGCLSCSRRESHTQSSSGPSLLTLSPQREILRQGGTLLPPQSIHFANAIKSDHWEAAHLDFIVSVSYRNTFCHSSPVTSLRCGLAISSDS